MLTRAEDVWIYNPAPDCKMKWRKGQHVLIADGFELEPTKLDIWEEHKDDPEFAFIKSFAEKVDGKVICEIISEDSVLGEVEGDLIQEGVQW